MLSLSKKGLLCVGLLIVLPLVIHLPDLSGWLSEDPFYLESGLARSWLSNGVLPGLPGWIDGNAGVTLQALGRLVAHDWRAGIMPWWNPYSGVGMPLAGEAQPAAFFLPFVLLLGLAGGVIYLKIVLQIVAGLASWALLRRLAVSPVAALLGGVLFELNGTFAWDADSSMLPTAFLPLFLLGIERAWHAARDAHPGGWRLLAVALGYSLVSGFPETAYMDGLLGLAWASLRLAHCPGRRWAFLTRVVTGGTVGLMLASPMLVAFVSFVGQTANATRDLGQLGLPPAMFAQFLFPYLYGPIFFGGRLDWWKISGYATLPIIVMALCGAMGGRQRSLRLLLAGWVALIMARDALVPGVTWLFDFIPFVRQVVVMRYASPSWELALSLLAAFAVDDLSVLSTRAVWRRLGAPCLVAGVLCVTVLVIGRPVWRDLGSVAGGRAWFLAATGFGLGSTGLMVLAGAAPVARRGAVLATILAADACVQFGVPLLAGTHGPAREVDLFPVAFLKQNLGLQRFYTLGPFAPNYGAYFGFASINHNYLPVPLAWTNTVHTQLDPLADVTTFNGSYPLPTRGQESRPQALVHRTDNFESMGVRYVLTPSGLNPWMGLPAAPHRVVQAKFLDIYELPAPAPYYEASGCVLRALTREGVQADCAKPTRLVRRELAFPGWRAAIDNKRALLSKAGIFQAVDLPAGKSHVTFRFAPPFARLATVACLAAAAAIAFRPRYRFIPALRHIIVFIRRRQQAK